jgi:hypothetical protein
MNKVKAVLYVCYTDCGLVESSTMRAFLPLINSTPIRDVIEVSYVNKLYTYQ